jgi:hypothetical protein
VIRERSIQRKPLGSERQIEGCGAIVMVLGRLNFVIHLGYKFVRLAQAERNRAINITLYDAPDDCTE